MRAFLAVLISGVILFGWSHFFGPKQDPNKALGDKKEKVVSSDSSSKTAQNVAQKDITDSVNSLSSEDSVVAPKPILKEVVLENAVSRIVVNNRLNIVDFTSDLVSSSFQKIVGAKDVLGFYVDNKSNFNELFFEFSSVDGSKVTGVDKRNNVQVDLELLEDGSLSWVLSTTNPRKFKILLESSKYEEPGSDGNFLTSFFSPSASNNQNNIRKFTIFHKNYEEFTVPDDDYGENSVKWIGIDSFYHLFALAFENRLSANYKSSTDSRFSLVTNQRASVLNGRMVFSKKYLSQLSKLGDNLDLGLDFGFFSIIAIPMFQALQFIHGVIPNWGFAIILLTLFIRFVTFPLYLKQMKSMNKMKQIQPQIQKIKEKYQDDPKKQQMETMELFKRTGVNPVGGCLPLVLQMPIFFAFYKVLTVSAELDQEPFIGWIVNLTEKDPYYVLPVLVAFVMWLNQKFMPQTTTDPMQKRVMSMLPILFAFIFINMPAGLNIYILVSTLFGIGQQIVVNKRAEA